MANRYYYKNHYSHEVDVVTLFCEIGVGAAGAVSYFKGGGIASVVKNATAGNYTINFQDKFAHFLGIQGVNISPAISAVSEIQLLATPATMQADIQAAKAITIQLVDFANAAVNATSGDAIKVQVKFRISSIGRND